MTIPSGGGGGSDRKKPAAPQDAAAAPAVAAATPAGTVEEETSIEIHGNNHSDNTSNAAAAAAAPPSGSAAEAAIATNQDDKFRADRAATNLRNNDGADEATVVVAARESNTSKVRTTTTSNGPYRSRSASSDYQQRQQPGAFAVTGMSSSANAAIEGPADPEDTDAEGMETLDDSATVAASATVSSSQQQHSSPEAEEEESVPVLEAELVQPPVEALKVVFDEDTHDHDDVESHTNRYLGSTGASTELALEQSKDRSRRRRRRWIWSAITVVLILCIVIPPVLLFQKDQDEEKAAAASTSTQTSGDEEEEAPATFPYECFRSTMKMFVAQFENPEQNRFIMCPNTRIQLGVMNDPANGDYTIGNGDVMLVISRDNVEVVCGDDGRVENNCVLDGGFVQVLLQQSLVVTNKDFLYESAPTVDNTTIRGMTFTGELFKDPFVGGSSIVMSHKGQNIRLIDCVWENMTAPDGLVFAGVNPYQTSSASSEFGFANNLPGEQEIEVKIENCTFQNISYGGSPLIVTNDHRITVENCRFSDIRLSSFVNFCNDAFVSNAQEVDRWCMSLFSCNGPAYCEISDICVNDFEYAGRAGILSASYGAEIVVKGTNLVNSVHASYVNETDTCTGGFSWYRSTQLPSSCMNMTEMDGTIENDTTCFA